MKETRLALSHLKNNDEAFFLIPPKARVLLPVSSSDHSLFLHECLKRYALYAKKEFEVVPLCFLFHREEKPLDGFLSSPHYEIEEEEETREIANRRSPSYVNKLKRVAYRAEAEALSCSRIALPTDFEDFLERFESSLKKLGKIESYSPFSPSPSGIEIIRPFLTLSEEDIAKGEEELGIRNPSIAVRPCPFSREEKDSFLKATIYGKEAPNLPILHQRVSAPLLPDLYFEFSFDEVRVKNEAGSLLAFWREQRLDAHRRELSSFFFAGKTDQNALLDSYALFLTSSFKPPLRLFIPSEERIALDPSWKASGSWRIKKIS